MPQNLPLMTLRNLLRSTPLEKPLALPLRPLLELLRSPLFELLLLLIVGILDMPLNCR
jgi:hypothetical protein